jgi:oligopeptide transport system substrate-binding protein
MRKKLITIAAGVFMAFLYACNTKDQHTKKQCLRINFKEEPSSLDPRRGRNLTGASHLHTMLFEGLMRLESDGSVSCAQAHSYDLSSDKKTYTFHLGRTFWSDGTPVTAYDFEKTWKNILDPRFPAPDAHVLYCVKNAQAVKKGELPLESVGLYAKDAKTFVIELEHPTPHFLQIIASSVLLPINQMQEQHTPNWYADAGDHFVCNGPFQLAQWKHHNYLVLEKNKSYRLADQVGLDAVHASIIDNDSAVLHMYNSGQLDIIGQPISPLPFDAYPDLFHKEQLRTFQAPGTMVCMFNTKQFPFYNAHIRQAFSSAIDRQLLIDHITQLRENPAHSIIPSFLKQNPTESGFKHLNLQQARDSFEKGLKELGITAKDLNGKVKFSYWVHDHACPMLPQALQQQWREHLGVEVEIEALEYKTLHEKGKNGLFSMGYFVFLSMFHDPIELLERFKYSHNPRNYSRWQNPHYTELLDRAAHSTSQEEHFKLLDQAEKILIDEVPFAPVFHWNYALLVNPAVTGFTISPLGHCCFDRVQLKKG